jgi:predicted RNase H-like nuclease
MTSSVTGIDACRGGWVAVTLTDGAVHVEVAKTLDRLTLARASGTGASGSSAAEFGVSGIDMPLGLLPEGWRAADLLARRELGRRGSCVFAIPPRPVWRLPGYADANRRCRELTGRGMSAQAWGLRAKLLEADLFRRRAASSREPLFEVHPELSFAALSGAPLAASKHSPDGLAIRRALLAAAGVIVPSRVPGAAEDDLLDAAAVAWSARRIAAGTAVTLTDPAQRADDKGEIAIRY